VIKSITCIFLLLGMATGALYIQDRSIAKSSEQDTFALAETSPALSPAPVIVGDPCRRLDGSVNPICELALICSFGQNQPMCSYEALKKRGLVK
jgi:hypothetical protein